MTHRNRRPASAPSTYESKREWNEYRREHECERSGKVQFRSEAKARRFARLQGSRSLVTGLYPYVCPHCGLWHLTSRR